MKDETEVALLWVRINEINCELEALSMHAGSNILRRDAGRRNADHEQRSAVLRHELAEVRAKLPAEGMASGQRLVMARVLGETILRDYPEPQFSEVNVPIDEWDWSEA